MILRLLLLVPMLLLLVLAASAWTRWPGHWRWLALTPLGLVVLALAHVAFYSWTDPTNNQFWPLELLLASMLGLLLLAVLRLLKERKGGR